MVGTVFDASYPLKLNARICPCSRPASLTRTAALLASRNVFTRSATCAAVSLTTGGAAGGTAGADAGGVGCAGGPPARAPGLAGGVGEGTYRARACSSVVRFAGDVSW